MPLEIKIPLDIPDVRLLGTEVTDSGDFLIAVESRLEGTTCHRCGAHITDFHGHDEQIRLRHLPVLNRTVFVLIRPRRYRCVWCRGAPTTTQRCTWYEAGRPHTKAYDRWLLLLLINSTIADVARKEGVGYKAVLGSLRHQIGTGTDWEKVERLGTLGIDEISLRKGHRSFVTILTSRVDGRLSVLAVLATRKKKPLKCFLRSIPERLLRTVESVCTEMCGAFTSATRQVLPWARLVVDRFHVAQHYREAADEVRRSERERLEKALPNATYEREVAGVMWLYRAKGGSLEPEDQARLERFFEHTPAAKRAWTLREQVTVIFEQPLTKEQAREALQAWSEQARGAGFEEFCGLLKRWKVIKRRCYGIFNLDDFLRRIRVDVELPHVFGLV